MGGQGLRGMEEERQRLCNEYGWLVAQEARAAHDAARADADKARGKLAKFEAKRADMAGGHAAIDGRCLPPAHLAGPARTRRGGRRPPWLHACFLGTRSR